MPVSLPEPQDSPNRLDELIRRLQARVRKLRKLAARSSSDLVVYDQTLFALKEMRRYAAHHSSQDAERMVSAFIAFIGDDEVR